MTLPGASFVRSHPVRYVSNPEKLSGIPSGERSRLSRVAARYPFRANDYYLSLIDWKDPNDPIRRLIVPHEEELEDWGRLDACNEAAVTVVPVRRTTSSRSARRPETSPTPCLSYKAGTSSGKRFAGAPVWPDALDS